MSSPTQIVEAYFAGVTAGDVDAVAALFAEDATLQNAAGTLHGSEAIRRMYQNGLKPGAMRPRPKVLVTHGDDVAVEIDLDTGGTTVALADFFTVRDGRIRRLAIYSLTPTGGRFLDKVGGDPGTD
ncbi:nuclear transport factor 2 family protein [Blastococcus sp. SYSU D00820]